MQHLDYAGGDRPIRVQLAVDEAADARPGREGQVGGSVTAGHVEGGAVYPDKELGGSKPAPWTVVGRQRPPAAGKVVPVHGHRVGVCCSRGSPIVAKPHAQRQHHGLEMMEEVEVIRLNPSLGF